MPAGNEREEDNGTSVTLLVEKLEQAARLPKRGRAYKKKYTLANQSQVISWKFNEWDYGKNNITLPSQARGLFILEDSPVIVARGYDKFFNVDEVSSTKWDTLIATTTGPYYVTLKENGCIILISGLEDGTLVVCSKHSTGNRDDVEKNHATAGQIALELQLQTLGLTTKDLALALHSQNLTAVAELCDDSFEEHIIEYRGSKAGLYLHGLNRNVPIFSTLPMDEVESFANDYGFKKIEYEVRDTIQDLKSLFDKSQETGSYNGKEVEGFVIRCKKSGSNNDFFFKFKFEEPYLMYRQWREATKQYISGHNRLEISFSKHKFITNKYLDFVIPLIDQDPILAQNYLKGSGIIELRNRFLKEFNLTGSEILNQEALHELEIEDSLKNLKIDGSTKFLLIPVATIGCGKTTTALTLTNLFNDSWGIVINDEIPRGKTSKTEFVKRALELLKTKKVVILDRNNHQFRERDQIFKDFNALRDSYLQHGTNVQFICLNFINESADDLYKITLDRVISRGDNHQSIKVETDGEAFVKGIMTGFIKRFQPVTVEKSPDSLFNLVINMAVDENDSSLQNAKTIMSQLHQHYPENFPEVPLDANLQSAFKSALEFKPTFRKVFSNTPKSSKLKPVQKSRTKPVYCSIQLQDTTVIMKAIDELILKYNTDVDESFWNSLKASKRIQPEFHITLAHVNQSKRGTEEQKKAWNEIIKLSREDSKGLSNQVVLNYFADFKLKCLIWNQKIMTLIVDIVRFYNSKQDVSIPIANKFPHITIATVSDEVKPVYSNILAQEASNFPTQIGKVSDDLNILHWDNNAVIESSPLVLNF